ncbi:hypothetical protein PoB_001712700 [Plakobranchus ocellatus]|uniref:Uncharacterized protein n=1 Tax=Plakobranchus ocellatus TaxID=259542 RepID=A0AAV3Z7Y0_9GAST|nr:hypothetical protein PoB_001712700 [Plakobranchus ocellatus]
MEKVSNKNHVFEAIWLSKPLCGTLVGARDVNSVNDDGKDDDNNDAATASKDNDYDYDNDDDDDDDDDDDYDYDDDDDDDDDDDCGRGNQRIFIPSFAYT